MTVYRNRIHIMLKRECEQGASQPGKLPVQQFRVAVRHVKQLFQNRLRTVQGIQQPEQRHVRHSKIRKTGIVLPTHGHQSLATRLQVMKQLRKFSHQRRTGRQRQQRGNKTRIPAPLSLCITNKTGNGTGQPGSIFLMSHAQSQVMPQYRHFALLMPGQLLHIHPF